jgi:hypothetical protein
LLRGTLQSIGLWSLVDGGAEFDEVLDGLLASGLSTLPGFVLVATATATTRVLVRGAGVTATIRATETVVLNGHSAGTWAECSIDDPVAVAVTVPDVEGTDLDAVPDYAIPAGLVKVARIDLPALGTRPATESTEPVELPAEDTGAAAGGDGDHDGRTVGKASLAAAAPAAREPVARLHTSDGQVIVVDRPVLIGRAPQPPRLAAEQPTLVTVPSRLHEISSTHVEVRPGGGVDHGVAVVTDMGSTNGTVLEQPGLTPENLQPGVGVALSPGAVINLGDGITIQVTRP